MAAGNKKSKKSVEGLPVVDVSDQSSLASGTVNLDKLRQSKVHFAVPCYGGVLTESTFQSFIKFSATARQLGLDWTLETLVNESLISRARNTLVAKFLNKPESTHLMFVDADIGWEPWHLFSLLDYDKDVIGGLYPLKGLPLRWVVNGFNGAEQGDDGLQEVSKAGTGFLLIKRNVFERLKDHPAVKPYANDIGLDSEFEPHLWTFFDTAVRQGRYYSEDWTFCENWRDMGGKIYVDRKVQLKHTGQFTYSHESQNKLQAVYGGSGAV